MPSEKIIQLHQALAARGLAMHSWAEEEPEETLVEVSALGSLVPGELAELCAPERKGAGLAVREVMHATVLRGHFLALVDGCNGFDPCGMEPVVLGRMLWVRTTVTEDAMRATDLLLRDGNLPLVIVELRGVAVDTLKRVPSQYWYRFQRLAKQSGAACLIVTPAPLVPCARKRWVVTGSFELEDLEREASEVLPRLQAQLQWRQGSRQAVAMATQVG